MHTRRYERSYPHDDLLNGEARAVIEAEFEETRTNPQRRTLIQTFKEKWQWIRQRLQRAS